MSESTPRLTAAQEAILFELMTDTFRIPEGRARRYLLQFREMALEADGDDLLSHGDQMDPRIFERAVTAFLDRARALDNDFEGIDEND